MKQTQMHKLKLQRVNKMNKKPQNIGVLNNRNLIGSELNDRMSSRIPLRK